MLKPTEDKMLREKLEDIHLLNCDSVNDEMITEILGI